ncbi:MAG: tRNA pseudouridine(38-40) synthase TruA [Tannerellaceae bacterium]|nr:tRNA pseudouridine(38-40) synthase TruA [Tannerellaceae bacterium]
MSRYFIKLSYDGAAYCGWQRQPNGIAVQQKVEEALATILRIPVPIVGAGRTDAGVHARMMTAHFDASLTADGLDSLSDRLNGLLPADIAVGGIVPVRPEAHARFSATGRTYYYYVSLAKSPFDRNYACRLPGAVDFDAMNDAAAVLPSCSDFTSFSKLHTDVRTNNCRISSAAWTSQGQGIWQFSITADRFLRNMVRAIVGTLLIVGRGKLDADGFRTIIEARNRSLAGTSAPAHGLFLADISYPEDIFL